MGLTRPRAHQPQDIDYKQTARVITTANVTLSGGAPAVVDGTNLALTNRVLVTAQSTGTENGIYEVTVVGSGSNGTWVRTEDANATGDIKGGTIIMITEGTVYADTQWKLTTDDPITIGSTAMAFARNGNAAFGIVAVAGQSNLVSDTIGDTLTVATGTNLTATNNAGTDTLTLTPSLTPALSSATITNTSTDNLLTITTTEDSSTAGPVLKLDRRSASPTGADYLGQLKFVGENDADQSTVYAKITAKILDASDGTEDGILEFANIKGGSQTITARLRSDSLQLLNNTDLTVAGSATVTGNVLVQAQSETQYYDSNSSNFIGLKAPSTVSSDVTYTLPSDGSNGQVLQTNGNGTLSFVDQSGGGGGAGDSFPNSTVTPLPSSEGNFDLAKQYDQTGSVETPFESGGTDAFGVNLGQIYTMMDPVGSTLSPTDLGVLS